MSPEVDADSVRDDDGAARVPSRRRRWLFERADITPGCEHVLEHALKVIEAQAGKRRIELAHDVRLTGLSFVRCFRRAPWRHDIG